MSLYNLMCGNNPLFMLYLAILNTEGPLGMPPRFRDAYTVGPPEPRIVFYTRTGGNNRRSFINENKLLVQHPLYRNDYDDTFDSTFAHWEYAIPERFRTRLLRLHELLIKHPKFVTPREKVNLSMAALRGKEGEDPEAYEVPDEAIDLMEELAHEVGMRLGVPPEQDGT